DETFTPPPLPPPPVVSPERRVAWVGLVVSPILLVLLNLWDYSLPGILSVGLVIIFISSFGYLVATMAPRDPDDDGARVCRVRIPGGRAARSTNPCPRRASRAARVPRRAWSPTPGVPPAPPSRAPSRTSPDGGHPPRSSGACDRAGRG